MKLEGEIKIIVEGKGKLGNMNNSLLDKEASHSNEFTPLK